MEKTTKKLTKPQVGHIAKLANLPLTNKEAEKFATQLSEVIDYNMDHLKGIDVEDVDPTIHVTGVVSVRRDETEVGLETSQALKNAEKTHNDFFEVDAILDIPTDKKEQK